MPIISPHGHVPPAVAGRRRPVRRPDLAAHLPRPLRLPAAARPGRPAGRSSGSAATAARRRRGPRRAWRLFCEHWPAFRGTPSRFWLESVLADVFGVTERPSAGVGRRDLRPDRGCPGHSRRTGPRALIDRFGISVLATTDDPVDDLAPHAALRADPAFTPRVVPTFRPDRYLEPAASGLPRARGGPRARPPGIDTGIVRRVPARPWRTAAATSRTTAPSRPTTAMTTSSP